MLSVKDFADVVKKTPIVAVDLIIEKEDGRILLGRRRNNPAKGFFFTFGGVLMKNETLSSAVSRISLNELGYVLCKSMLSFNGVFECIFDENFLDNIEFSSHYINLSYYFEDKNDFVRPLIGTTETGYKDQHLEYVLLRPEEIQNDPSMHPYLIEMIGLFSHHKKRNLSSNIL